MIDLPDPLTDCAGGLTIRDPWAQAIVYGPKRIENRTWRPPDAIVGEHIAIGVSQEMDSGIIDRLQRAHICQEESDRKVRPEDWGDWRLVSFGSDHHPGHIIGTVRVEGYAAGPDIFDVPRFKIDPHHPDSRWYCETQSDVAPKCTGNLAPVHADDWFSGPIGWLLSDPQPLDDPIPVRGMPGIWDVAKQVKEARQ